MESTLVQINTATANECEALYGIGSRLAKQIVKYRKTQGYFHGPEDLAKVAGISTELAITLSPHIDWGLPEKRDQLKERDWFSTILYLIVACTVLWFIIDAFQALNPFAIFNILRESGESERALLYAWMSSSVLLTHSIALLALLTYTLERWTRSKAVSQFCKRINFLLITFLIVGVVSELISTVVYYGLYYSEGCCGSLRDYFFFGGLVGSSATFILLTVPKFLLFFNPKLAHSTIIAKGFDIGVVALGPTAGFYYWFYQNSMPWWVLGISSILCIMFFRIGWGTLRGKSLYISLLGVRCEESLCTSLSWQICLKVTAWERQMYGSGGSIFAYQTRKAKKR